MKILLNFCKAFVAIFALMLTVEGLNAQSQNSTEKTVKVEKKVDSSQNLKEAAIQVDLSKKTSVAPVAPIVLTAEEKLNLVNVFQQELVKANEVLETTTDPQMIEKLELTISRFQARIVELEN